MQNPACYVTVSLRKLVTLNLRYRSAGRATDRARRKAEKRYSGTHRDIARACEFRRNAPRLYPCSANADDFETPLDFDSDDLAVALCVRRAPSRNREFQRGGIRPPASPSSPKFEPAGGNLFVSKHSIRRPRLAGKKLDALKNSRLFDEAFEGGYLTPLI